MLLLAAAQAAAQQAAPAPAPVPAGLAARIAADIGARWAVPASAVRLDWGRFVPRLPLKDATAFRLVGNGDHGWFAVVFEPAEGGQLAARLRAGVDDTVAVATRPLGAGSAIAAGDVALQVRVRWSGRAVPRVRAQPGWRTRRPVAVGDALEGLAVQAPPAVTAGSPVRIEWRRGDVNIELGGIALNAAAVGEPVSVRFDDRSRTMSGIAAGTGRVRIGT